MSRVYHVTVLQMMPVVCLFLSLVVYLRLTGRRSPWFWLLTLVPVPAYVFRILREGQNTFGAVVKHSKVSQLFYIVVNVVVDYILLTYYEFHNNIN